jgi:hypothetical protein
VSGLAGQLLRNEVEVPAGWPWAVYCPHCCLRSLPCLRCFWRRFGVGLSGAVAAPENGDALDSAIMCMRRGRRNAKGTVMVCWFTVGYALDRFEEHLKISVDLKVFPVSARRELN